MTTKISRLLHLAVLTSARPRRILKSERSLYRSVIFDNIEHLTFLTYLVLNKTSK